MSNGLKIKNSTTIFIIVIGIFALGIILACVPRVQTPLPVSSWGDKYFYSYEPPEKRATGSVKVTIAIVSPYFSEKATLEPIYSKVGKGFSKSMSVDLDNIIVAKGMTVTGPFESLDMMTYPDKKNADLSLTPEFFINVQSTDFGGWHHGEGWFVKSGFLTVDAWVVLTLREPLSSEKIWIKKIEVKEKKGEKFEMYAEVRDMGPKPGYKYVRQYGPGYIRYDGRKDAVANIIKQMYPNIMQTCWNYINSDELLVLKEKAEEIRKLKRY